MFEIDRDALEEASDQLSKLVERFEEVYLVLKFLRAEMEEEPLYLSLSQSETIIELIRSAVEKAYIEWDSLYNLSSTIKDVLFKMDDWK